MKALKILAILFLVYVGIVVAFESLLGYFQPAGGTTMLITTTDDSGQPHDRVVSQIETGGKLYVAANHWPRAWYNQVLERPDLFATIDSSRHAYRAVPVTGGEYDEVDTAQPLGMVIKLLTGFPPRRFVRLDPVEVPAPIASPAPTPSAAETPANIESTTQPAEPPAPGTN